MGMNSLEDLILGYNELSAIECGMFMGLTSLINLRLAGNHITDSSIKPEIFTYVHSIKVLHLESNMLTNIELGAFSALHWLNDLALWNNRLTKLNPDLLINSPAHSLLRSVFYLHPISGTAPPSVG